MRLKESQFLALGEGARLACRILPASAFKLYVHLCFLAERQTGRAEVRYGDLAKELGRCERSLGSDFDLLKRHEVCIVDAAVNRHKLVLVEISDRFWAYEKNHLRTAKPPQTAGSAAAPNHAAADENLSFPSSGYFSVSNSSHNASASEQSAKQKAFRALLAYGIAPAEARSLTKECDADSIVDGIEYVMQLASVKGSNIRSPQSLLIHRLRNCAPVPQDFVTSRERERQALEEQKLKEQRNREHILQFDYEDWCRTQGESELQKRLLPDLLEEKISRWVSHARITDPRLANIPTQGLREIAHRSLLKEVCAEMDLPTFQEWCRANGQQIGEEEGVTTGLNRNRSDS